MALTLDQKFRQSTLYTGDMLIRDLIDVFQEVDAKLDSMQLEIDSISDRVGALEEVGTWVPSLTFGGNADGMTWSAARRARYAKIGKFVFYDFDFGLATKGTSVGDAYISGFPYPANTNSRINCTFGYISGLSIPAGSQLKGLGYTYDAGTTIRLTSYIGPGSIIAVTNAHFNDNTRLMGSGAMVMI